MKNLSSHPKDENIYPIYTFNTLYVWCDDYIRRITITVLLRHQLLEDEKTNLKNSKSFQILFYFSPILQRIIIDVEIGMGSKCITWHNQIEIGVISNKVVALSKIADKRAVNMHKQ